MIGNLSMDEFAEILHANISPTSPIQSEEHLVGRAKQLQQVAQALYAAGRTIFIYGERGVGKTSLAQTVAYSHQSSTHDPILLACTPETTFTGLLSEALAHLQNGKRNTSTTAHNIKVGIKGFGVEYGRNRHEEIVPQINAAADLNSVANALIEAAEARRNEKTVVVVDEFDRITSDTERAHFADFIKQLGDQKISVRFVFCGVAESLQKLLGSHGSCYRYLESIELKTLSYDARFEIIDNAAKALGVVVDSPPRYRIAAISDGFPHYIHRMCENLFWQMHNDPIVCTSPTGNHYREAVAQSVMGIEQHLRQTYDKAVMKDAQGYEEVLWAVADRGDLIRRTDDIYDSYLKVMESAEGEEGGVLDRQAVMARLNSLKGKSCASILMSNRKGYYQFHEGIMRGYVRLRAEERGCELALEYSAGTTSTPSSTFRPRLARRGRFGTRPADRKKLEHPD
jgi:archaellum biogenesis ATPase FlaH